jgi:hypothetical protein
MAVGSSTGPKRTAHDTKVAFRLVHAPAASGCNMKEGLILGVAGFTGDVGDKDPRFRTGWCMQLVPRLAVCK